MKIDYIYIINLQTDNNKIINKLNSVNWPYSINYEILPATNGWEIIKDKSLVEFDFTPASWWEIKDNENKWYSRQVTPGEIGCTLSHYRCIKKAYEEGYDNVLILEEDFYKLNKSITEEELKSIPKNASIIYLDRNKVNKNETEKRINKHITKIGYSYNTHAYIITRKGMKEVLESPILNNVITPDEYYSALNGTSNRKDAVKIFKNSKFKAYTFNGGYFGQSSLSSSTSLTESPPEVVSKNKVSELSILDDSNWENWSKKYINSLILNKEYDLAIDEPAPHVYTFPFFTKAFCKELIELSEQFKWTTDRHTFYPTTDNLLEVLGMNQIWNRIINDYVRPLAINRYELVGKSWEGKLHDESFIIKYPHDQQAHLSLHHDFCNITTLVNLNPGEFKGGGTYFPKYKRLVNPEEIGVMTLHPGSITHKHGARPVIEGTRYVVVSFIRSADHSAY